MGKTVRVNLRPEETYGYCHSCNKLVRRTSKAACPQGHGVEEVSGLGKLGAGVSEPPALPRFNWAAFLMPPVWGVGHGSWPGGFVLPMWLFADSAIQAAVFMDESAVSPSGAFLTVAFPVIMSLATLGAMLWYGFHGWGIAWRKSFDTGGNDLSFDDFVARERRWLWVSVAMAVVLVALAAYFWLAILIPNGGVAPGK